MTACSTSECGVGGWNGPLPGDPDNNSVLTATPAFGGIDVTWSYPATNPEAVAYVMLYRGILPDFNSAILIANVGGNFFYDKSTSPQLIQYYYWIKIVSVNGTIGALIGPASAIARPPISAVIEQLTGQIDAGLLAQSLKTEIDKITLNYQDLLDEVDQRIAANTALSAALAQVQAGVTQSLAYIGEEITQRQEGDSALVSQVNTVASANASNLALIQQEQVARVEGDSANAALYTTLNSQVNNVNTGLPATRATLINDYYTKAGTNSAISSATSSLVSTTSLTNALSSYTTTAALQNSYYTKTQTDSAISSATTTLVSTASLNTALGNYTPTASLQNEYYTKAQTDSITSLSSSTVIAANTGITRLRYWGFDTGLESWSSNYATASNGFVTWTPSVPNSTFVRSLDASEQYLGLDGPIVAVRMRRVSGTGAWEGNLYYSTAGHAASPSFRKQIAEPENPTHWNTVKWDMRSLTAGGTDYLTNQITQLRFDFVSDGGTSVWEIDWIMVGSSTDVGEGIAAAETSLQATIDKVTGIGALYTAKVTVNGLIGGFGVYNNGTEVQAGFDVDTFWVGRTNADKKKPFIVQNNEVFIDQAVINELTFTKLRDESGSVMVENGKLKAQYITADFISAGGVEIGKDVGPGTGHYGLCLSPDDYKNVFFRRSDGVVFFRINEGGTNSLTYDSQSGNLAFGGQVVSTNNLYNESVNIFKLARGASLPDYVRTFKGGSAPTVPVNSWMPLQLDPTALNNRFGANDYDAYRVLLPAGTYFYELSVPVKCQGSDTNDACYTAIISNPPGTPNGTTQTVCGNVITGNGKDSYYSYQCWQEFVPTTYNVLSTAGVNVVGDWQTATIFGVGRFTLSTPAYISAAVMTTDGFPRIDIVARTGYSTTILRIWRDNNA